MSEPKTDYVDINGEPCRVWRKGSGPTVAFLAGHGGMPKWMPFLDALAERFEVVVPSLPGFPGSTGHKLLDSHIDWIMATRELLDGAGIGAGARLLGSGPGGSLAAEVAAFWPGSVARLALIAPWGLYDEADPMADPWSARKDQFPALMCENPERWIEMTSAPEGANSVEWPIEQTRALEAAARIFWPLGDTRLKRRLHRIQCPTLLIRGERDRIIPRGYTDKFRDGIGGDTTIETIPNAGHLAELDVPDAVVEAVAGFMQN